MLTYTVLVLTVALLSVMVTAKDIRTFRSGVAALCCLLPLLPPGARLGSLRYAAFFGGAAWLAIEELRRPTRSLELPSLSSGRGLVLGSALLAMSLLLFVNIDMAPGWTHTWEKESIDGFAAFARSGKPASGAMRDNLFWSIGSLTDAHRSLFYGTATHAAFTALGYSETLLRAPAALLDLVALVLLYTAASRLFSPSVGVASALFFTTNESALFYGRYGSSPTGSFVALVLAYWACSSAATRNEGQWWRAALAAIALYFATLQYAAARIPATAFAILTPLWILRRDGKRSSRLLAVGVFAATLLAVWKVQLDHGTARFFHYVRGEQIFSMLGDEPILRDLLGVTRSPGEREIHLGIREGLIFVGKLLEDRTLPQLLAHLDPFYDPEAVPLPSAGDPPPIRPYLAPFVVFLIMGIAYSARRVREWNHLALFVWTGSVLAALLLTTRVDSHRLSIVAPPVTIWLAFGALGLAQRAQASGASPVALWLATAAVFSSTLPHLARALQPNPAPSGAPTSFLTDTAAESAEDLVVLLDWESADPAVWNHQQIGSWMLRLLERQRTTPGWSFEILPWENVATLTDDRIDAAAAAAFAVEYRNRTLMMFPASRFRGLVRALEEGGRRAEVHGDGALRAVLVGGRSEESPGPASDDRISHPPSGS